MWVMTSAEALGYCQPSLRDEDFQFLTGETPARRCCPLLWHRRKGFVDESPR